MIKAVVTDIEGTTSSLSFVKEILFPYARQHLAEFVREESGRADVQACLQEARHYLGDESLSDEALVATFLQWIDEDKKVTPLKTLQGLIWEAGYQKKDFYGHIYDDAFQVLQAWFNQGLELSVYSSGSVYAQKLLYGHTEHGDLTKYFSNYFDTRIGAKAEQASYTAITEALGYPAEEILFLSDIKAELDAATAAGMNVCWLRRDGERDAACSYQQVGDFQQIILPV